MGLQPDTEHALLQLKPVRGTCRVVCYSPRHDLTLARLEASEISQVIETLAKGDRDSGAELPLGAGMVDFEMLSEAQIDLTPEVAAAACASANPDSLSP